MTKNLAPVIPPPGHSRPLPGHSRESGNLVQKKNSSFLRERAGICQITGGGIDSCTAYGGTGMTKEWAAMPPLGLDEIPAIKGMTRE